MENRPNPDALLRSVRKTDNKKNQGRLKLFFGMAAGVGKTYAMLSEAHSKIKQGRNVQIGALETHGRSETMALVDGIPWITKARIDYRGTVMEEMDTDAIIRAHPDIILVDELAHTNVPGSKHPKRWQDVFDILSNGIDVYSTINVQHIESRKDDVEAITGVVIRETIPDSIIERADTIEVVDIHPQDLLTRMREGKVYLGDKADKAEKNFFKEDKLTALREILLRLSADKVDKELESLIVHEPKDAVWKTQDKLLVAVGHGLFSEKLIRATKQVAQRLKAPWMALYVDTGDNLSSEEQNILIRNLDLARELGAQVQTTSETDMVRGIDRVCRQYHITQLVIGRPGKHFWRDVIRGGNILERLNRLETSIAIHIVRNNSQIQFSVGEKLLQLIRRIDLPELLWAILWMIGVTLINTYLYHYLHLFPYRSVGMIFLLGVSFAGVLFSLRATVFIAIIISQIWNFFFIPPLFTFHIQSTDDIALCLSFLGVASITGALTSNIKRNQNLLRKQEEKTSTLYLIAKMIVEAETRESCLMAISSALSENFRGRVAIALKDKNQILEFFKRGEDWQFNQPKEWAVAQVAFETGKAAGLGTDTLPLTQSLFIPLTARGEVVGVIGYRPHDLHAALNISEREMLFTVCSQLGLYLQRELFQETFLETEQLKKAERLHQTLLNSVSHEIKTPLTAIAGIVDALHDQQKMNEETKIQMHQNLTESVQRLKIVVENILDMSRLNSGVLDLKKDWHDILDLTQTVITRLRPLVQSFPISIDIPTDFPLIFVDGRLFEQVLTNLLLNATQYSPSGTAIHISARADKKEWRYQVADEGPGIPLNQRELIFEKFYRMPNSKVGGTGLGLSIVKSIIELHHGKIEVIDSAKGANFQITLPMSDQPFTPKDLS